MRENRGARFPFSNYQESRELENCLSLHSPILDKTTILIPLENISSVDLLYDIVEAGVVAVGDDGLAHGLEFRHVVDHEAAEEGGAVLQGRLVDNDLGAFGLDAFHHALDRALAEVVAVRLHPQYNTSGVMPQSMAVRGLP